MTSTRFAKRAVPVLAEDDSSPAIHVDFSACILCDRCIRGCAEIRHNYVIARQGKGYFTTIAFDANQPMGNSTCVSCGECMVSCPTGALTNKRVLGEGRLYPEDTPNVYSVETEELLALPMFKGVSGTFLELNTGSVVKRVIKAGEIVVREGDNGSTAFYILEGEADVFIGSPREHVATAAGAARAVHARCAASSRRSRGSRARRSARRPRTSASTRRWTCRTRTPSRNCTPATCSAR